MTDSCSPSRHRNSKTIANSRSRRRRSWLGHGALQYTECAGDDLSADWGRSFTEAAATTAEETVIFAWAVFGDRESRDAANAKIMADERLAAMCEQTGKIFECKRMAFAGFKVLVSH